ncbi:MerR family transcriptional regulator [Demequina iriomotensis]|uniref:MerR family transcriptional regulator n=1 Tax=Demequina iriomotensis TaxID=1536641 RepID=UPI000784DAD6|nr:MerR family transcriptional regulator [Demequina iriomotensis]
MHSGELLSIGAFAALSRLSVKALRHYDEQGLLAPVRVDPVTSYRWYSPDQVRRAALIGTMRRMDVPLPVIRAVLDHATGPEEAVEAFTGWWAAQERRHDERRGIGRYLTRQLRQQGTVMDISTRSVPERTLAVIGRELYQPELEPFIMEAFSTLFRHAEARPGLRALDTTPAEPTYVIYHGPVTPDQSALVEACIVVSPDARPAEGVAIRLEPAHEEAYATLTRAEVEFPDILDAYDAVAEWVLAHGTMREDLPSREVYFTDVMKAAPGDPACDVAFPFVAR